MWVSCRTGLGLVARLLTATGLLLTTLYSQAGEPPLELTPFKAHYRANFDLGMALEGSAEIELVQKGAEQWQLTLQARTVGASIEERSRLEIHENRLRPLSYNYKRKVLGNKKTRTQTFDWNTLSYRYNDKPVSAALSAEQPLFDKLGYQLQLWRDTSLGLPEMHYQIADGKKLVTHRYRLIGEERVDTPLGSLKTFVVERERGQNARRSTRLWLSTEHPFLIVRLEQEESDGKDYVIELDRYQSGH